MKTTSTLTLTTTIFCLHLFLLLGNVSAQPVKFFQDDFSSSVPWTQVGTNVLVTNGRCEFQNDAADGVQRRIYASMDTSLTQDETWCATVDCHIGTINLSQGSGHTILALTAGTMEPYNNCTNVPCSGYPAGTQDCILITLDSSTPNSSDRSFLIVAREGNGSVEYRSPTIGIAQLNTDYYLRLERTSATNTILSVYTDSSRTVHASGSPVSFTVPASIEGLTTVQVGAAARGDSDRQFNGWVDNICISNCQVVSIPDQMEAFACYPNPTQGVVKIQGLSNSEETVKFFDIFGKSIDVKSTGSGQYDLSQHANGIYFVKIGSETPITRRIIKAN